MPRKTKDYGKRKPVTIMVKFGHGSQYQKVAHTYSRPGRSLYQQYLRNGYKPVMTLVGNDILSPEVPKSFAMDKTKMK